jgi:hypothetical protein
MAGFWQWLRIAVISAFLLLLVWVGVKVGLDGLLHARMASQRIASILQIGYGLASVAVLWSTWRNSWWLRLALFAWGAVLVITSCLAPMVWARANWMTGAFTGIVALFAALLVGRGCEAHARWSKVRKRRLIPFYG